MVDTTDLGLVQKYDPLYSRAPESGWHSVEL